ncbi:phage tail protein [Actinoplanes sp. NPDC051470]|uniref:phage tail protein n=1 Tax=unclassified Actinoplanes TaxID=2626549 RepID=UPI00344A2DDA
MRLGTPGVPTPHPIGERLPAVYHEDEFTQRFTSGLDDVLAPLFLTLDSFPSYLDPRLAPPDFLAWLSQWVAFPLDDAWPMAKKRELVANAVYLHGRRGTTNALEWQVRLLTGGEVEITDSGVCRSSEQPGEDVPGDEPPWVTVKVRVADPATVDAARLRSAVVDAVPAHVRVTLEIEQS